MQIFEFDDIVVLLRREVDAAGGQVAWSKRMGVNRIQLNQVLNGRRLPSARIIAALNLRVVFTPQSGSQKLPYRRLQCSRILI
jgi:DNA-binding transcriptional regulator YdaS (Cro superfamily)